MGRNSRAESESREVRDPIHGLIEYNEQEEKLINSSVFQRLRGIKQLALANLVYPGAHHTRFEHCIGTMHLAGRMAEKLKKEKCKILRLAGLLHDIGHGPFSHVSELIMEKYIDKKIKDKYKDVAQDAHELMSILLIQNDKEISEILNQEEIDEIVHLLQNQKRRSIERDIISGPLDADKLDYLLRDSHFAGVKYGVFDLDKIVESLTPIEISTEETQLGISEEGIYAVEQVLLAKYHMNTQVYQHRIRRITDAMLIRGIEYAIEEIEDIRKLYTLQDTDDFREKYVKYDDTKLIDEILSNGKGTSFEYFRRIKKRKLLKEVLAVEINGVNCHDSILLKNIRNMSKEQRRAIEDKAAKLFFNSEDEIINNLVIVDKQPTDNPTFKSPQVKIDTETIMVEMRDGLRKDRIRKAFPESSAIFSNPAVDEKDTLYIYLPLDEIEKREGRKKDIGKNKNALLKIIKESCR